ncbi:MAG: hypothetical protein EBY63_05245 [Flavobacteriia bacterium]|nr:hypothetical protein [Flavobacteriia bacterium]
MTLIKSISGIRGTIGGAPGDNLTPIDAVKFAAGYGSWLKTRASNPTVVIGRDARPSGPMLEQLVISTLQGLGIDVINAGLSTTPTRSPSPRRWTRIPRTPRRIAPILPAALTSPVKWKALIPSDKRLAPPRRSS